MTNLRDSHPFFKFTGRIFLELILKNTLISVNNF